MATSFPRPADVLTPDIFGGNDIDEVSYNAMADDMPSLPLMACVTFRRWARASWRWLMPQKLRDILAAAPPGAGGGANVAAC